MVISRQYGFGLSPVHLERPSHGCQAASDCFTAGVGGFHEAEFSWNQGARGREASV